MQPKKQLKVQYIGFFEEIDSFYWPKMRFLKKGQKIRAWVDPPPHSANAPKKTFFFPLMSPLRDLQSDGDLDSIRNSWDDWFHDYFRW